MNKVEVRLYASLRKYHPDPGSSEAVVFSLDNEAKLGDLLDKLKIPREEIGVLMVNGNWQKESYLLKERDRIGIFPLIGGG
ncbi:MAG: MoaD/ThiS family protein [Dehalococcoidales bacterium]